MESVSVRLLGICLLSLLSCRASTNKPIDLQTTPAVRRPDHVVVVSDSHGFSEKCPDDSVAVRQLLLQIVDASGQPIPENISIRETYDSRPINTCTGERIPPPSDCHPTGTQGIGLFLDTLTVSLKVCHTGIKASSQCGFKVKATWRACSHGYDHVLWESTRDTRSDGIAVDGNISVYAPRTPLR